jgi:hypothetical protein
MTQHVGEFRPERPLQFPVTTRREMTQSGTSWVDGTRRGEGNDAAHQRGPFRAGSAWRPLGSKCRSPPRVTLGGFEGNPVDGHRPCCRGNPFRFSTAFGVPRRAVVAPEAPPRLGSLPSPPPQRRTRGRILTGQKSRRESGRPNALTPYPLCRFPSVGGLASLSSMAHPRRLWRTSVPSYSTPDPTRGGIGVSERSWSLS